MKHLNRARISIPAITILISSIILVSCNFNATYNNRVEDKSDAEKVTDAFYNSLKKHNYTDTYRLFSKRFFEVTDTSKLNDIYEMADKKLGPIDNIVVDRWQTNVIRGTNASSNYAFVYKVKRRKYDSEETITLLKENDSIKIISYNLNSDGLFARDTTK